MQPDLEEEIYRKLDAGVFIRVIAAECGVSVGTVSNIKKKRREAQFNTLHHLVRSKPWDKNFSTYLEESSCL